MKFRDTLLLAADTAESRAVLRGIFEASYHLLEADNRDQAMLLLRQNRACIAAVLLDIEWDGEGGTALLEEMSWRDMLSDTPVMLLLGPEAGIEEGHGYEIGASDVIVKPCDSYVIRRRVQTILELFRHKWNLEELVEEQARTLRQSNDMMVGALSNIIEYRSLESGQHILRIRRFTQILLTDIAGNWPEYGLTAELVDTIASASALHDIGKISVPDAVLNKPGHLTREEFEVMKSHTLSGARMLEGLFTMADAEYMRYAYNICRFHHERWDGKGYPDGLKGDQIPICAQAVGLADVYDALTTPRVYKAAYSSERAVNMILNGECGTFSPKLLESFKNVRGQFAELAQAYADGLPPEMEAITKPLPTPVKVERRLNSLQRAQVKYQALLHYLDAMVLEVDLNSGVFHMVYNPNPDFNLKYPGDTFDGFLQEMLYKRVHPEDREDIENLFVFCAGPFFQQGLWKYGRGCRLYSSDLGVYRPYEVTVMRINLEDPEQKGVLVVTRPADGGAGTLPGEEAGDPARLSGNSLCCRSDGRLTIAGGAGHLRDLTGYAPEEIRERFHDCLLEMILPEDREEALRAFGGQLAQGNVAELEYRMRRKDGQAIWVLGRYRRMTGGDGLEYLCCDLIDNTQARVHQEELERQLERQELIIQQSDDIVFQWDSVRDTLTISDKWEQLLGYKPVTQGLQEEINRANHFHPDDVPAFKEAMESMWAGECMPEVEARVANNQGRYLWCRFRASAQFDESGRPLSAVGVITNIDAAKRAELAALRKAERDALTKLLNKHSVMVQIKEYLLDPIEGREGAVLLLDLDNFRELNDRYGSLFGDEALSQTAEEIRRIFRKEDIVGRVGGDEFLIFLPDIPGRALVEERCRQLVTGLQAMFRETFPHCRISCSVGAALTPKHGDSYQTLFRHASEALYQAKRQEKNRYMIYDTRYFCEKDQEDEVFLTDGGIDSDAQPAMASKGLIQYVFQRLYEAEDLEAAIQEILELVGRQTNASRAYIFENNSDDTTCSNTFEWCKEGILPQMESAQNLSYATDLPGWKDGFDDQGVFYSPDVTQLPQAQREIMMAQGIKSVLLCAIWDNGQLRGFVGFDECDINRIWTHEQVELLNFLARMLSLFLLKKRAQEHQEMRAEELTAILDNQDAWIYIIDEQYRIKYLNARVQALLPMIRPGMHCYEGIMRREEPCVDCPAVRIRQAMTGASIIENPWLNLRVRSEATRIRWEGEEARLVSCHYLEKITKSEG